MHRAIFGAKGTARRTLFCLAVIVCIFSIMLANSTMALAAQGTITIDQQNNEDATYDAYCLFHADVDGDDIASNIAWSSDDVRDATLRYLATTDYDSWLSSEHPASKQRDLAQHAAEYLSLKIGTSDAAQSNTPNLDDEATPAFACDLAQFLVSCPNLVPESATAGIPFEGEQGYWLFVTNMHSKGLTDEAGTEPIWIALGGSVTHITEKTSIPTVDKQVWEDDAQEWTTVADAHHAQAVSYRLIGTLPSNFDTYASYHYQFRDELSDGLALAVPEGSSIADAIQVSIDQSVIPIDGSALTASVEGNVLTIDFADLKSSFWSSYHIDESSKVTVTYQAQLTDQARIGVEGNPNTVRLTYSNDPVSGGDGETRQVQNKLFSYALQLKKVDRTTSSPLAGASFVVQKISSEDSRGHLYIQQDGSLGQAAHVFTTDAKGSLTLSGLDEGRYLISETKAPDGYAQASKDIELCIESDIDAQDLALSKLTATLTSGDAKVESVGTETGLITLLVHNDPLPKQSTPAERLAQTGVTLLGGPLIVAGIALAGTSFAFGHHGTANRSRRKSGDR